MPYMSILFKLSEKELSSKWCSDPFFVSEYYRKVCSGVASIGAGGQSATPDSEKFAKNREKSGKKRKIGKNQEKLGEKEEKSGRKGKNREDSFT